MVARDPGGDGPTSPCRSCTCSATNRPGARRSPPGGRRRRSSRRPARDGAVPGACRRGGVGGWMPPAASSRGCTATSASWQPPRLLARWLRVTEAEVDLAAGDPAGALERVRLDRPEDHDLPWCPSACSGRARCSTCGPPHGAEGRALPRCASGGARPRSVGRGVGAHRPAANRLREDRRADEALHRALVAGRAGGHPPAVRGLGPGALSRGSSLTPRRSTPAPVGSSISSRPSTTTPVQL